MWAIPHGVTVEKIRVSEHFWNTRGAIAPMDKIAHERKRMPILFVPQENISEKEIIISDLTQIHHLRDVLRKKLGDLIIISDEYGNEYTCTFSLIEKNRIIVFIKSIKKAPKLKKAKIVLACAIPKRWKFDLIVEKTTELGVDRIIPLITERSIIRIAETSHNKINRYRRIAQEASKQAKRANIPIIDQPLRFAKLSENFSNFDLILMPNLSFKKRINIFSALKPLKNKKNILILIGPEGDFTPNEVKMAKRANAIMLSLGQNVLKVETAAIVCVAILTQLFSANSTIE